MTVSTSIGEVAEELRMGPGSAPEGGEIQGPRAGWKLALQSFVENKLAVAGTALVIFFVLFCFVGPILYKTNQTALNPVQAFDSPSAAHLLGTDSNGFDELGRMMQGGQAALAIGFFSSLIATVIGTLVGAVAGLLGGFIDAVLMRIVDVLLSIPLLFVILIVSDRFNGANVTSL